MHITWAQLLNIMFAGLVTTIGFWLAGGAPPLLLTLLFGAMATGFLWWRGPTIGAVWAWATLLLGLESLAWPVLTMVQIRQVTDDPSDQQMGAILSAVVAGLLSSVFWVSFSYGLFKRAQPMGQPVPGLPPAGGRQSQPHGGKSRGKGKRK